jgi:ATP-binding cassette subfamily B protein
MPLKRLCVPFCQTSVDNIIVLDKGARGRTRRSHDALMAQDGLYKRLYTLQEESLGWSV